MKDEAKGLLVKQDDCVLVGDTAPNHSVYFHSPDGNLVGTLDFNGAAMTFNGDAEESAKMFFDFVANLFEARLKSASETVKEANNNDFTQAELQFLKDTFKYVLQGGNADLTEAKNMIKFAFEKCDPGDETTLHIFESMNNLRSEYRKMKKDYNKLAVIQGKIKRKLSA